MRPNQILTEHLGFSQANLHLEENEARGTGEKSFYLSGIFIQGDVKNHNGRVYPSSEIRKAVDDINHRISKGFSVLGEVDHPETLTINLDRVSHVIESMWMNGSNGHGKLKILPTPMGKIIGSLLESGVKLGVSSRGSGNLDHSGNVTDFEIITVDIVANPSAPDAYPKAIYESLMNMNGGMQMMETARHVNTGSSAANRHFANQMKKFISELGKK
jgi:hypothetical protein